MCMHGWTVTGSPYTQYWASDLHHRLFHTIKVGEGLVDHYADDYGPSLQLAMDAPEEAVRNSHSLALFALDVYAFDVAAPNEGCTGEYVPDEEDDEADEATSTSSSMAAPMTTSSAAAAEATAEAASATADEAQTSTTSSDEVSLGCSFTEDTDADTHLQSCHTHEDGQIHCV